MPYLLILERLLRTIAGAEAALLFDQNGEVVVQAGAKDERHRLIGAYQGIGLATAARAATRYETGRITQISCRFEGGTIVLTPLNDGYYLIVSLAPTANLAVGLWHSAEARASLNAEL